MSDRVRNLYVDLFRGLALFSIYIDHIPNNPVSRITLHSLGFFDAAEVFVFLAGFATAKAFGRSMESRPLFGAAQILQRCWTLYVTHIFLFMLFVAEISWTVEHFQNPMFAEEMRITRFLDEPYVAVMRALVLQFQPAFLDILPLYIALLLGSIPVFLFLRWNASLCLAASFALWLAVQLFGIALPAYPGGVWLFNPMAWQIVFVVGMAIGWDWNRRVNLWHPALVAACMVVSVVALATRLGLDIANYFDRVPEGLASLVWPFTGKSNLMIVRLVNFLALAHTTAWITGRLPQPDSQWLRPIIQCGQNSLYVFCIGLSLSFFGHLILVEVDDSMVTLALLNIGGIVLMIVTARVLDWFKGQQRMAKASAKGGAG